MVGGNPDSAVEKTTSKNISPQSFTPSLEENVEQLDLNLVGLVVLATEGVKDVVILA